jgi:hypothetical protein
MDFLIGVFWKGQRDGEGNLFIQSAHKIIFGTWVLLLLRQLAHTHLNGIGEKDMSQK